MALEIQTAGTGVVRDAHYVTPTGASTPVRTLLLEPQRTNLCIRSEELGTWTDTDSCAVASDVSLAPNGTTTADRLSASATTSSRRRGVTFTGDGVKCASLFLKAESSAGSRITIRDLTASANRHVVNVAWSGGVPTLSTGGGAGTLYPPVALGNGWWRVLFSADAIVAANNNEIRVTPDYLAGTGTVLAWGAQAENAVVPSSYIPTEATTVTRNADSLYWDIPALVPREMTVYVRGVYIGLGVGASDCGWWIGNAAGTGAGMRLFSNGSSNGRMFSRWTDGTNNSSSVQGTSPLPVIGSLQEYRATLSSAGSSQLGYTQDNGAEALATAGASVALTGSFSDTRFYLNSFGTGSQGISAITNVAIALGTKTRAEMRAIAGVP